MPKKANLQEYISVGELSVGFSENIVQPTDALAGKKLKFYYESGIKAAIDFKDGEALGWGTEEKGPKRKISMFLHGHHAPQGYLFGRFYSLLWRQPVGFHHS